MLPSSEEEEAAIADYYRSQSPDASVEFLQKVYSESVIGHRHDVWDVHASDGRWWVITNPTNLYSQDQFPNMDLAVTFHMGLCLRIPRGQRQQIEATRIHPFGSLFSAISETGSALAQADDAAAFRTIGVRCRENLLEFIHAAQDVGDWGDDRPKRSDFRAWSDLICNTIMPGSKFRERRRLSKVALESAWTFTNWLTHSQSATWHDAEAARDATAYAIETTVSVILRHLRGVPEQCPDCGSFGLAPEEGVNTEAPEIVWERPVCGDCGWTGEAIRVGERSPEDLMELIKREGETGDECGVLARPLTGIVRPSG